MSKAETRKYHIAPDRQAVMKCQGGVRGGLVAVSLFTGDYYYVYCIMYYVLLYSFTGITLHPSEVYTKHQYKYNNKYCRNVMVECTKNWYLNLSKFFYWHLLHSLITEWLGVVSEGHKMYCRDLEVIGSNPAWSRLLLSKLYLNKILQNVCAKLCGYRKLR